MSQRPILAHRLNDATHETCANTHVFLKEREC